MSEEPTYYEKWGPVSRRLHRAGHACRSAVKNSLGLPSTVLVEIRWRLGDEVMAIPVYEALRNRYPTARIEVLCNYPELLDDNPFVDAVNPTHPSADRYYLVRDAARDVVRIEHYAQHAGLERCPGQPKLYCDAWTSALTREWPQGDGPIVAVAAGASWDTKRWPMDRWRELCSRLLRDGCRVIALGSAGESPGVGVDFSGRTSVRDAAVLLRDADVAISNDSGLMHVALAAGTPVIGLFGPTDPEILVPGDPRLTVVTNGRECGGCWNISQAMTEPGVCPLGVESCTSTISVGSVLGEVDRVLAVGT